MIMEKFSAPAAIPGALLQGLVDQDAVASLAAGLEIRGLSLDSRTVVQNDLFFALPGATVDGRQFARSVVDRGAAAVVYESSDAPEQCLLLARKQRAIGVSNLRSKLSLIAGRFFANPSVGMNVIGFTGTNGKTTCAYLLTQALNRSGERCAMMGTIGTGFPDQLMASNLTTGDAVEVQRILRQLRDHGANAVCMEVSSHGLDQDRVAAVNFNVAIFTNLTQDHLDYHGTLANYSAAKKKLFDFACLNAIVVNKDDPTGREILKDNRRCRVISYGYRDADIVPQEIRVDSDGIGFRVHWDGQTVTIRSSLLGQLNIPNLLAIVATLLVLDYSLPQIAEVMPELTAPPGRMELFNPGPESARVVVDYSHTPDSLERALKSLRAHCRGELWVVFGCGGDRDRGKRPVMGKIAVSLADHVIITNDNPRNEDPASIVENILQGIDNNHKTTSLEVIYDRRVAIARAMEAAAGEDLVLIAGKGHEQTQTIGDERYPFSDREVVEQFWRGQQ